ncbi:MAG: hypothetical protein ACK4K0_03125 [Flavobacteriales bacterium]
MLLLLVYKSETITIEWSEVENLYFLKLNSEGEISDGDLFEEIPRIADQLKLRKGNVLIIPNELTITSIDVIKKYVSATAGLKEKEAIVVKSLAQRILANFMIRYVKQSHSVKIFSTEEHALSWLNIKE